MTNRTAVVLDAIPGFTGTIDMDITPQELDVGDVASLFYWPYINASYGRVTGPTNKQGLYDRLTDTILYPATATAFGIGLNLPGNIPALSIWDVASRWIAPLPAIEKGFSAAAIVAGVVGFSSNNNSQAWWLRDDGAGKLYFKLGTYTSLAADYTGPLLSTLTASVVVFVYDKAEGSVTIRVNGVQAMKVIDPSFKTMPIHPSMQFGVVNDNGAQSGRFGYYGGVLACSDALKGTDLAKVEALLLSYNPA